MTVPFPDQIPAVRRIGPGPCSMFNPNIGARKAAEASALPHLIRADARLAITGRLAWLMTALAYKNGFASMSAKHMADQLRASSPDAVRQARSKLVKLGLFASDGWKYPRILLPGETAKAHWQALS